MWLGIGDGFLIVATIYKSPYYIPHTPILIFKFLQDLSK